MKEQIEKAVEATLAQINIKTPVKQRAKIFIAELKKLGITGDFLSTKEVPSKGKAFTVLEMCKQYRVNIRCGYGPYNHAPCVHIAKI